jgi:pimeloyl-ACP methyl ester carboxylesterase
MDLLTTDEEVFDSQTAVLHFDIEFLALRLIEVTRWLLVQPETAKLPIGYFGASTGAAAVLVAAAELPDVVEAVRGADGQTLPEKRCGRWVAPTLLIVGGNDPVVLELNREALAELPGEKKLEIVPGATHLFEEPGAIQAAAQIAKNWFALHLSRANERRRAA